LSVVLVIATLVDWVLEGWTMELELIPDLSFEAPLVLEKLFLKLLFHVLTTSLFAKQYR